MKTRILVVLAVLVLALPFVAVQAQDQTIVDIAAGDPQFSTLVAAVEAAGLTETLAGEGPFTVFAPTNDAFAALGDDVVNYLLSDTELLTRVLTYHVIPGAAIDSAAILGMEADLPAEQTTVEGGALTVDLNGESVTINQATVTTADIVASNGIIHVIDSVLLPEITLPAVDALSVTGDVVTAGSSTVFPLAEAVVNNFENEGYAGSITVDSVGTGGGFERFCVAGETDIANASRPINEEELAACEAIGRTPLEFRVGTDALAVVVNPANPIEDVTLEQLAQIYGTAADWSEIDPANTSGAITRYIPGTDSGTFDYFVEEVFDEDEGPILATNPNTSEDDNQLVTGIAGDTGGTGFFGFAYYLENADSVKILSVDGVEANAANVNAGAYPLARPLFIYSTAEILQQNPAAAAYVNYFLTTEDDANAQVGYFSADTASVNLGRLRFLAATSGAMAMEGGDMAATESMDMMATEDAMMMEATEMATEAAQ